MTDTAKATANQVSEFVRICRAHKARTGTITGLVLFQTPDEPFYRFECASGDAKLSFTALAAVSDEYDALKAVEAAAREVVRLQIVDTTEGTECLLCGPNGHADFCEFHRLKMTLAAIDAIRTPDDGKRGGARL